MCLSDLGQRIAILEQMFDLMDKPRLNRLKVVLAEKRKTGRWLAGQLGYNETTVSRWVNNKQQPSLKTFNKIAAILEVNVTDLFENSTQQNLIPDNN